MRFQDFCILFKVLHMFWDKTVKPEKEKWKIIKDALNLIGKKTAVKTTGVDELAGVKSKKTHFIL